MHRAMTQLLYGCGLRLSECCTLRVRDLDFDRAQIIVRQGKGDKDRLVMLPRAADAELRRRVAMTAERHRRDTAAGGGGVPVPDAVAHKIPAAAREVAWQFVFPSRVLRRDADGRGTRWHIDKAALDRAIRAAAHRAGLLKRVSAQALRHSFATHLLESGYDIRQAQTLLGHASVTTTMIYTHLMNRPAVAVASPLGPAGKWGPSSPGVGPTPGSERTRGDPDRVDDVIGVFAACRSGTASGRTFQCARRIPLVRLLVNAARKSPLRGVDRGVEAGIILPVEGWLTPTTRRRPCRGDLNCGG